MLKKKVTQVIFPSSHDIEKYLTVDLIKIDMSLELSALKPLFCLAFLKVNDVDVIFVTKYF